MVTIKIRLPSKWLFLPAMLMLLGGCTPPGPRALLEGKKLLEDGKSSASAEKFKLAASLMPTNAMAFNYLGVACQAAGQNAEAERAYVRALALDHELAEVHFNLGCLFLAQNKLEQAKSEFTAFTLRRPNAPEGFLKLGAAQLRSLELTAAERSFNDALRLSKNNPEALTGLGFAKLLRNRPRDAIPFFTRALQERPDYRPALVNMAVVAQEQLKDRQMALNYYKRLLTLKPPPENASAIQAIARSLELELNPPAAPASFSNAVAQVDSTRKPDPKPPQAQPAPRNESGAAPPKSISSAALTKAGPATNVSRTASSTELAAKSPPAQEIPKPALSTPPLARPSTTNAPPAAPLEVVTLTSEPVFKTGQDPQPATPPAARKEQPPASSEPAGTPQDKPPRKNIFQKINPVRLFTSDDKPPATNTARQATASIPAQSVSESAVGKVEAATNSNSPFPRYAYKNPARPVAGDHAAAERAYAQGIQAQQSQKLPEAIQSYRRAIQLDPAFFNAYYNLAIAATSSGNLPLALSTYETALAVQPDFVEARYSFALVLKQSNHPLDAAVELQKILTSYPNDSRAHLALANLYAGPLDKPPLARQHYLKVLEIDPRNPQAANIHYWLTDHPK